VVKLYNKHFLFKFLLFLFFFNVNKTQSAIFHLDFVFFVHNNGIQSSKNARFLMNHQFFFPRYIRDFNFIVTKFSYLITILKFRLKIKMSHSDDAVLYSVGLIFIIFQFKIFINFFKHNKESNRGDYCAYFLG
jgi:hypothetical protein